MTDASDEEERAGTKRSLREDALSDITSHPAERPAKGTRRAAALEARRLGAGHDGEGTVDLPEEIRRPKAQPQADEPERLAEEGRD